MLDSQVAACLQHHLKPLSRIAVGYSGGLDSTVLLHVLAGLREPLAFTLSAVHVHHGLSPKADDWARHCAQVCQNLAVPLTIHPVGVQLAGEGLEAAARAARYRIYVQLDSDFLILAHHRDDQAETVLLQLLRGAGVKGLAAMPEVRSLTPSLKLLRPLLTVTRDEIATWAERCQLAWIEDESNADTRLTRNALRRTVLPGLTARFPEAPRALAHAAAQFAEAADLLDALADLDSPAVIVEADLPSLSLPALRILPEPRARNVLRRFLAQHGVDIHHAAVCEALRQLLIARQDRQVRVDFGAVSLRRYRQMAQLVPAVASEPLLMIWQGEVNLDLPGGAGRLCFQSVTGAGVRLTGGKITIRHRAGGERLRLAPERPRRTLKNLLREAGIAAWQRASLPLIYVDDTPAWVAWIGADCDFLVKPDELGWLITWQPGSLLPF